MVIAAWNRLLRLPNLLLILISQILVYSTFIRNQFAVDELPLNNFQASLFLFVLVCVAASGYIINAIYDRELDAIIPGKEIIPKYFDLSFSWKLYKSVVFIGFITAFYLSYQTGFLSSLILYPVSVICLWFYSYKLKCFPLLGNLLIALFTTGVIAIIPYVYWDNLYELRISDYNSWAGLMYKFVLLITFAFLSNLAREISKDLEDEEQDRTFQCKSTANYFGINNTRFMILNIWLALLIICGSVVWHFDLKSSKIYTIIFLVIPACYIFLQIIKSQTTKDFSKLSLYMKCYMFIGLMYWCLIE